MDAANVLAIAREIAGPLAHLHAQGLVHGNLSADRYAQGSQFKCIALLCSTQGRPVEATVLATAREIAGALAHLHAQGLVQGNLSADRYAQEFRRDCIVRIFISSSTACGTVHILSGVSTACKVHSSRHALSQQCTASALSTHPVGTLMWRAVSGLCTILAVQSIDLISAASPLAC